MRPLVSGSAKSPFTRARKEAEKKNTPEHTGLTTGRAVRCTEERALLGAKAAAEATSARRSLRNCARDVAKNNRRESSL